MQVFVTGASGFVGSAVTAELLAHGHRVLGLARSDRSADALARTGAQVLRGDLEAPETLREGARLCDAIIHTGFIHDFAHYARCCAIDRAAIETLGAAIAGTNKPFIVTAGLAGLGVPGEVVSEDDIAPPPTDLYPRASDMAARALTARGIPTMIMRLPPSVHGRGDHGFVPMLIALAREKGRSAYVGGGSNAWPAAHVTDAARAYRLAVERGPSAETFHAAAERGVPFRDIAQAIAGGLDLPCVSLSAGEARTHFGWMAHFTALDQPTASERTRHLLDWHPRGPDLLTDMAQAGYFPVSAG
ncbi:SDR family oxidoreductase [Ancylobacter rudongensis]|uniref:Nucleoside-diphosphate-sugar epimerase n=1 Tax=Ancylobacter rudongensis TaxID=177413 RepID=A0A1G4QHH1_9HYPH|nr:SDR family oxidoreductase [Ancylobacter rudongensis]SCW44093.1 Nucleoside-diphosphate-sugar epimerase [Ancylobacter rudongensis]